MHLILSLLIGLVIILGGCQKSVEVKPIATVDGIKISLKEFNERIKKDLRALPDDPSSLKPEEYDRLREEVLNALINEKVLLIRARELSLSVSDEELKQNVDEVRSSYPDNGFERMFAAQKVDFDAWKEDLRKRMLLEKLIASDVNAKISVTENEAREYFKVHRKKYISENRVHVVQIVVRNPQKAETVLNRLKNGEDFGKVAREESIGPEAARGGDLGFVRQGVMPEEIDAAIFSQSPGKIGKIVKSPYGYHIFKVIKKEKRGKKNWPDVKEQVLADLRKQKEEWAYERWIDELRSKAVVKINRNVLKESAVPEERPAE